MLLNIIILFFNVSLTLFSDKSTNYSINEYINYNYILRQEILTNSNISNKTIVIDPGHGGKDNGTSFGKFKEKEITLSLALKLREYLNRVSPNIKVVLTRSNDIFIPLYERIDIANKLKADLFVSIHCNSYKEDQRINGIEVFTLGITDSEDNLEIAMRENASVLLENDHENNYEWYDPNSIEAHIFLSAFQNIHIGNSVVLANRIGTYLHSVNNLKNRGVKQSGFVILKQATMPSILIETGFLSNTHDRKALTTVNGQEKIAKGISKAIVTYLDQ